MPKKRPKKHRKFRDLRVWSIELDRELGVAGAERDAFGGDVRNHPAMQGRADRDRDQLARSGFPGNAVRLPSAATMPASA